MSTMKYGINSARSNPLTWYNPRNVVSRKCWRMYGPMPLGAAATAKNEFRMRSELNKASSENLYSTGFDQAPHPSASLRRVGILPFVGGLVCPICLPQLKIGSHGI